MQDVSPHESGDGPPDKPTNARGFWSLSLPTTVVEWIVILGIVVVLCGILLPGVEMGHTDRNRLNCANNLKQLGFALDAYHDRWRCFPPAYVHDAQGQPWHSWRAQLLNSLEHADLAAQYHWDEPWDADANAGVARAKLDDFRCLATRGAVGPSSPANYFAVVGEGTAWPGATSSTRGMFTDGASSTLLLTESSNLTPHWMAPVDLQLPALPLAINATPGPSISSEHQGGAHILLADGGVRFLSDGVAAPALSALLTIAGRDDASGALAP